MKNRKLWYEFPFSYFFFVFFVCWPASFVVVSAALFAFRSILLIIQSVKKLFEPPQRKTKKFRRRSRGKAEGEGGVEEKVWRKEERGSWHWARGFGFLWFLGPLRKYFLQYNYLSKSFQFLRIKKKFFFYN